MFEQFDTQRKPVSAVEQQQEMFIQEGMTPCIGRMEYQEPPALETIMNSSMNQTSLANNVKVLVPLDTPDIKTFRPAPDEKQVAPIDHQNSLCGMSDAPAFNNDEDHRQNESARQEVIDVGGTREWRSGLSSLFNSRETSDCEIISQDGSKFYTHKLLLGAFSQPLRQLLADTMSITLNYSKDIVYSFLSFIYKGEIVISQQTAWRLYEIAKQFGVTQLASRAEAYIAEQITMDNLTDIWITAHEKGCTALTQNCIMFCVEHLEQFITTQTFLGLPSLTMVYLLQQGKTAKVFG